jgi:hypothetical protein
MPAPLMSEVLPPQPDVTHLDQHIETSCGTCGETQRLSEANVEQDETVTTYICKNGCGPILKVTEADRFAGKGGYKVGDWTIRNPKQVLVYPPIKVGAVAFPPPESLEDF